MGVIRHLLHRIASKPRVYDVIQWITGERRLCRQVGAALKRVGCDRFILDLGGGTGAFRKLAGNRPYVCVDIDPAKLGGFRRKNPAGAAVRGDITRCPFVDGSADVILSVRIAHHLSDDELRRVMAETARVLAPDGTLILSDALFERTRWLSRVLWALDRGARPRTNDDLIAAVLPYLTVRHCLHFTLSPFHRFVIVAARRPESAAN